jgi:hypothetical protein
VPQFFWTGEKAKIVLMCEVTNYCIVDMVSLELAALEEREQIPAPRGKQDD